jgi:cell division septation protein DedD
MNHLLDDDEDDLRRTERELTLSTGMILGIFLVLVLLCGAFFGFGYKMGSRPAGPPTVAASTDSAQQPAASGDTFSGFKPAAGSPAGNSPEPVAETAGSGAASATETASPAAVPLAHAAAPVVTTPEQPVVAGTYMVQVAAVSHEEDAQLLVTALKAKGYPVTAHTEPADKFFHIQVGPFATMKDAAAAKQRLVTDGYQPIIK